MPSTSIMNSGDALPTQLERAGWRQWSDNRISAFSYYLVIQHPEVLNGREIIVAREEDVRSAGFDKPAAAVAASLERLGDEPVLFLDGTLGDLEDKPDIDLGGELFFRTASMDLHAPVSSWHEILPKAIESLEQDLNAAEPQPEKKGASKIDIQPEPESQIEPEATPDPSRLDVAGWVLSDEPTDAFEHDVFGFRDYAESLHGLINDPNTTTPLVLAINAPWGAGKSSLGLMVRRLLEERPAAGGSQPHVTAWFNAWMHDGAEALDAALCAEIGRVADAHRSWWRRHLWEYGRTWATALVLLGIVGLATYGASQGYFDALMGGNDNDLVGILAVLVPSLGGVGTILVLAVRLYVTLGSDLIHFIRKPRDATSSGTMAEVREQLGDVIRAATPEGSRFVVFIDDIERCHPPKAIDLLEAVNQLLGHENVVVVLMGDMPAIAANVELKYKELVDRRRSGRDDNRLLGESYGRQYLQKIIQLQFDLPPPLGDEIKKLLDGLATREPGGDPDDTAQKQQARRKRARTKQAARPTVRGVPVWMARLRRALDVATGMSFALTFGVALLADRVGKGTPNADRLEAVFLGMIFLSVGCLFGAVLLKLVADGLRGRYEKELAGARTDAVKVVEELAKQPERLYAAEETGDDSEKARAVEEQKRLFITSDSALVKEALATVLEHMPLLPRNAKRMLNKLRLLILVSHARGLIREPVDAVARRMGKWVVLNERWPEVAQALRRKPGAMQDVEAAATVGAGDAPSQAFTQAVTPLDPVHARDVALERFLATAPPLAPAMTEIVSFRLVE